MSVFRKDETEKLGIQFNGLPPGPLSVKSIAEGSCGDIRGIEEDDVLLQVGNENLQSLDDLTGDAFKAFLKARPVQMVFESNKDPYLAYADSSVAKLGITFNGMPPGQLRVKSVASGEFGSQQGVHEGDVLLRVGKTDLVSLEGLSAEDFKSFLKDRPLRLEFTSAAPTPAHSPAATPRGNEGEHKAAAAEGQESKQQEGLYEIVADATVSKMGISFNGLPPGQLRVKSVASGEFGSQQGVHEGDVLLRVGKTDLVSLEGLSAEDFKSFLKDRPLRLEFTSAAPTPAHSQAATPRRENDHVAEEKESDLLEGELYEVVADETVNKMGVAFHGMPPGQLRVKSVADGEFMAQQGVNEGDVLLRVGKTDLVSLEGLSPEDCKSYLKDRPLRLEFKSAGPSPPHSPAATPRGNEGEHKAAAAEGQESKQQEGLYEIVADATVSKMGISFNGLPPGQLRVKSVASGEFGSQQGVHEGDVLLRVGKTDLVSLEGLSAEDFKSFLKDRPLRLEFTSAAPTPAHSQAATPRAKEVSDDDRKDCFVALS